MGAYIHPPAAARRAQGADTGWCVPARAGGGGSGRRQCSAAAGALQAQAGADTHGLGRGARPARPAHGQWRPPASPRCSRPCTAEHQATRGPGARRRRARWSKRHRARAASTESGQTGPPARGWGRTCWWWAGRRHRIEARKWLRGSGACNGRHAVVAASARREQGTFVPWACSGALRHACSCHALQGTAVMSASPASGCRRPARVFTPRAPTTVTAPPSA